VQVTPPASMRRKTLPALFIQRDDLPVKDGRSDPELVPDLLSQLLERGHSVAALGVRNQQWCRPT
jgi:hypothetical protein